MAKRDLRRASDRIEELLTDQPGVDPKATIDGEVDHLPPGDQGG
jgi:hypothetical protein